MHTLIDLLAREGAYVLVLLALGSGPASLLSAQRFDWATRLALMPVLGFCVGTCVATTVLYFVPAGDTYWMLPVLAVASAGFAVWRTRRGGERRLGFAWREVAQLALVVVLVAGPLTFALAHRDSVGPAAYYYTDVDGYVAVQDGAVRTSLKDARATYDQIAASGKDIADRTQWNWAFIVWFQQNLDAAPLNANMNALLGLGATETHSSFLIVLLLAGALAAFAAVRYTTRSRTWAAALTGALFGGPFFLELWFDGFQAAIIAIGLLMPAAMLAGETIRAGRWADVCLLAVLLATMATVYPLFLPVLGLTGALVLAWLAVRALRGGVPAGSWLPPAVRRVGGLVALICVFNPVAITRDLSYYRKVLNNEVPLPRVPWTLPVDILPGWLLQTRGFWAMPPLGSGGAKQLVLAALVPLVFFGIIAIGLHRYRQALLLVGIAALFGLVAEYSYVSQDSCAYCAGRVLLPLAPIGAVLLGLGVHALVKQPARSARIAGVATTLLIVAVVGQRARIELARFVNGSYFLDTANRTVLTRLPDDARKVQLEGYGQTYAAQAEQPLVYHLVNEHVPGRVSVSLAADQRNSTQYLGGMRPPGPEFDPHFDYVLTRFASIDSGRQVVAADGPIALERRTAAMDVIPYSGLTAPLARIDPAGTAWLDPSFPLRVHVVGGAARPAWARLSFRVTVPVEIPRQAGVSSRLRGRTLTVCVRATGAAPIRDATVTLQAAIVAAPVPSGLFPPAVPPHGVALSAMRAVSGRCTP